METKKIPKNPQKYICINCDYSTLSNKDFRKHEMTRKHIGNTFGNNWKPTDSGSINEVVPIKKPQKKPINAAKKGDKSRITQNTHRCENCNNEYLSRGGLWKHNKTCIGSVQNTLEESDVNHFSIDDMKKNVAAFTRDMVVDLLKQNKELQSVLVEQNMAFIQQTNKMLDMSNRQPTIIQNTTTNNQFNLNFFLNEQCKNAVNIQDFLDNIQLTVADIEATGRLGYVNGISRIFINKLKEMDIFTRPLHCTDLKRETVYIRDKDMWEKEKDEQPRLKKLVKIMARKNLKQLPAWQEKNPEYAINNSPQNEEFTQLSLTCLGSYTEEEDEKDTQKILRNVLKEIRVDRN